MAADEARSGGEPGTTGPSEAGPACRTPRREREQAQHRREARQAAERLLAQKSFQDITVQEIAREAEFSVGYLYKLFPGKEDIFLAVIRRRHEQLLELVEAHIGAEGDPLERLERVVRAVFTWMGDNLAYAASSMRDLSRLAHSRPEMYEQFQRSDRRMHEMFCRLAAEAMEQGLIAAPSAELVARTVRALSWGFIKEELSNEQEAGDPSALAEHVVRVILRAFAPGAADARR